MTPTDGAPPIRKALAILFDHPEVLTLDPAQAHAVQARITNAQQDPEFAAVWQYISTHPADGSPDGWMTTVPITLEGGQPATGSDGQPLAQWQLSDGILAVVVPPLTRVLLAGRAERTAPRTPGGRLAPVAADPAPTAGGWTLTSVPQRHGLEIASLSFDGASRQVQVRLRNRFLRHLAVYLELYADGRLVEPPAWASRLPPAAQGGLETATTRYLSVLPPTTQVAGMPLPIDPLALVFVVPEGVTGIRLRFGGLGIGCYDARLVAAAALLTAVLEYALPVILDGVSAHLDKSGWYSSLLADATIQAEIIEAAGTLAAAPACTTIQGLLAAISGGMGALLLGQALPTLRASIAQNVSPDAIAKAAPVLGWGASELAAQVAQPLDGQISTEALASPAVFSLDLASLCVTVQPDPRRAAWPDPGVSYQVVVTDAGTTVATVSGTLPADGVAPITVTVPPLPVGRRIGVSVSILGAAGQPCGEAQVSTRVTPTAPGCAADVRLVLTELPVAVTAATRYQRRRTLAYDPTARQHVWQPVDGPPDRPTDAALPGPLALTLQETAGALGYTWRGGADASQFGFQSVGVRDAEAGLKFSGLIFPTQPFLVYDQDGPAQAALEGTGRNYFLDPRTATNDGWDHLRRISLAGGTPFDLDQTASWGAFLLPPTGMAIHPAGFAVACSFATDTVQAVELPTDGVPASQAPLATVILGPGTGLGAVRGPVAVTVTPDGQLLVLEQDNRRVQAFDPYGNPARRFADQASIMPLQPEDGQVQYLDLGAGRGGTVYVLSKVRRDAASADYRLDIYQADGTFLARIMDVVAARLAVDGWGRVYTLDYHVFEGPGGRHEPGVSQWFQTA